MSHPEENRLIEILRTHQAYVTRNRLAILKVLSEQKRGITLSRLKQLAPEKLDRVSIYRVLRLFRRKGIIMSVPNSKGIPRYIMTEFLSFEGGNKDQLSYFICNDCGHMETLPLASPQALNPLTEHSISNSYMIFEGLCSKCKK